MVHIKMTTEELARQAFEESCNPETGVRNGSRGGYPFWNGESSMFMYVPAFHFAGVRDCTRYRFDAVDEQGGLPQL